MNNLFTLSKKQQKCYVNEENKDFSVDGSEYNVFVDFLLLASRYRLKYKLFSYSFSSSRIRNEDILWEHQVKTAQTSFLKV